MRRAAGIAGALVIVGAFVVALALAPVSAQQHPASPKQSGGGALAGADYQCVLGQFIGHTDLQADQPPLNFKPSQGGVTFGSSISTAGTPPFSSFTLQPGKYQLHLSGNNFLNSSGGLMTINAVLNDTPPPVATWNSVGFAVNIGDHFDIAGGDRLISVAQVNTALQFFMSGTTLDGRVRASSSSPNCNERGASARPMPFSISVLSPQLTARLPN